MRAASCTFLCLKWAVLGAIRAVFGSFLITSGAFLLHLRRFAAICVRYKCRSQTHGHAGRLAITAGNPAARGRRGNWPGKQASMRPDGVPLSAAQQDRKQIISRRHRRSSGRPPRAEERRSAGGPPRHQLRPRGAPLRPDSRNDQDRGSTSNRGGEGHPRRESSSHTSTGTSSGSSPAARGQPHPAAASSTATQTSEPTVNTTNHQTSSTRAERARRWRKRVSPYGRATRHGGPGVGRTGGYE